jgi:hypothetical protein
VVIYLTAAFEWRFKVVTLVAFLTASNSAVGQWMGRQTGCYADPIAQIRTGPTVSNPAHVTQYGVLELEYGWDRFWPQEGIRQTSLGGLLKFGMFCDIELLWNTTSFLSQTDAGVRTKRSVTTGSARRSGFIGRRNDCRQWLSIMPSRYLLPIRKMGWARGAWITHSPSGLARISRVSISISISPNS